MEGKSREQETAIDMQRIASFGFDLSQKTGHKKNNYVAFTKEK